VSMLNARRVRTDRRSLRAQAAARMARQNRTRLRRRAQRAFSKTSR
jgi:hypothetical protein